MSRQIPFFLNNLWKWKTSFSQNPDLKEEDYDVKRLPFPDKLAISEWSDSFEKAMRKRLIMGTLRYGLLNAKNKVKYNRMDSIIKRAKIYAKNGNLETLVDIANLALLEFEEGEHPNRHFKAVDDGIHVEKI